MQIEKERGAPCMMRGREIKLCQERVGSIREKMRERGV
jgi:hypothetical protein